MSDGIDKQILQMYATMNFSAIIPVLIISGGAILLMLTSLLKSARKINEVMSFVIAAVALFFSIKEWNVEPSAYFNNMIQVDHFSTMATIIYIVSVMMIILLSSEYLTTRNYQGGEYYSLLFFALSGMIFITSAGDLITFYLGLETLSISLYILIAIDTNDQRSTEAGLKYFLMSAFSSAFLLYGIALVYGATGSTSMAEIKNFVTINSVSSTYLVAGSLLLLAGVGFKISMFPFHMWTPDTYEGAPLSVTAFISTAPKVASFAFLFKFYALLQSSTPYPELLENILAALAVLTMLFGNFLALNQSNIKRLLASSSITHMGYVLIALAAHNKQGLEAAMFYFIAYVFMNTGIFALLSKMSRNNDQNLTVENLNGLSQQKPGISLILMLFLFTLSGMPPTVGFFAKFYIFNAAIEAKMYGLAVLGILNSAISAYYYLRIIVAIYMKPANEKPEMEFAAIRYGWQTTVIIAIALIFVIMAGVMPDKIIGSVTGL